MSEYSIRSVSIKGNFEIVKDGEPLCLFEYKGLFSGEAKASFNGNDYVIKSGNFWQTHFDVLRNEIQIGKIYFNWKGQIVVNYTNHAGKENEFLFESKGVWKIRFIVIDRSGNEVMAMSSSWSKTLKYHYDISFTSNSLTDKDVCELLIIAGYSANLFMSTMMAM